MRVLRTALLVGAAAIAFEVPAPAWQGGQVWVVDGRGGPGADFTTIHDAVAAAQSGDRVLVRPGFYGGFVLDGKGVDVVADTGGDVFVGWGDGTSFKVVVENVSATESVTLRGLQYFSPPATVPGAFTFRDNLGPVWVEDCDVYGGPAVYAWDCASVALVRCTLQGTISGGEPGTEGPTWPAIDARRSNVWLHGGSVLGADGYTELHPFLGTYFGYPGAPAASLEDGTLSAAGSELAGGDGGAGIPDPATGGCHHPPTDGAPAVQTQDAAAVVHVLDAALAGGTAGASAAGCPTASTAPPIAGPGIAVFHPGGSLALSTTSPVREGQPLLAQLDGTAGDLAFVGISLAHGGELLPTLGGALLLAPPFAAVALGPLPAGGALGVQVLVPELGPGVQGLVLYLQAGSCSPGGCSLGTASATLLLDAAH